MSPVLCSLLLLLLVFETVLALVAVVGEISCLASGFLLEV